MYPQHWDTVQSAIISPALGEHLQRQPWEWWGLPVCVSVVSTCTGATAVWVIDTPLSCSY